MTATGHPLDTLRAEEITTAVEVLRASGHVDDVTRFAYIGLHEPDKAAVGAHTPGDPIDREVRLDLVRGPTPNMTVAIVSVTERTVRSIVEHPDVRPALLFEEAWNAIVGVREHPDWQAAMRARGISDFDLVQIDPWPAGAFGLAHETDRRICRCLSYVRADATDNGYARPVEGVVAFFDLGHGEVLEVVDHGDVGLPPERGSYYPADVPARADPPRPLEITQPDGPSFSVEGNLIAWSNWSLRVAMDPYEGLVLHTVGYQDHDRLRPVLHRGSVSEMVVPYGDPDPMHSWKNAFDAGEWGLGRMAGSLTLGCDCVGVIHYLDAVFASETGDPFVLERAVCIHEEDYGILWKHVDGHSGTSEVRRSRRLVVSSISTVGNYDYGFFWYLYLDGSIQFEVKLTGVLSTRGMAAGETSPHAPLVAPQLGAPVHQHLFNLRLDLDVDGPTNEVYEVDAEPLAPGNGNPLANAWVPRATRLGTEHGAQRLADPTVGRYWKVVNPAARNRLGEPVGYKLVPGATPTLLAHPSSSVAGRAVFATRNLWVTPYRRDELRAAGSFPNQHQGGDGLPAWTAADRSLTGTDVVLWYTFGVNHVPRPEEWPVMPVEYAGFLLAPVGFFDRNPALDLPATAGTHCDG